MDHLHSIFMAEAVELLEDMEKGLLKLETNPGDQDGVARVFRCMHTLKGSAKMFGFDAMSELTHHLESVYQAIREGSQNLTPGVLETTYKCFDHLGKLLHDPVMSNPETQRIQAQLLDEIDKLTSPVHQVNAEAGTETAKEVTATYWYVSFVPHENILKNGTNTLYLIEDLLALGSGSSRPYFVKPLDWESDPERSYTAFEIILESACSEAAIREVFMFVESECELVINSFPPDSRFPDQHVWKQVWHGHDIHMSIGFNPLSAILAPDTNHVSPAESIVSFQQNGKGSIRVPSERIDELMNLVSELVTTQARLSLFATESMTSELVTISENVENITRRLRDNAFSMSLIPVESLVVRFQRLVRDLSKELGKEVIFKTEGTETEIDKSIIEKLTDPVLHLLRNALDHGIESPDTRQQQGKPRQGTLILRSYYSGTNVVIEINDDGAGIDLNKVKQKAITTGIISANDSLSEEELIQLIFHPGFSTVQQVTGVSGRGVGMDVVKRNITDIQGDIEITTKQGQGTTFVIRLPLTLSIIDGLLVSTGPTSFILPMSAVRKCYEVETRLLENETHQQVVLDGDRIPVFNLCTVFTPDEIPSERSQVITVLYNKKTFGLAVATIIGEYQAVLKPLGNSYRSQDEFSGATILGDGSVALVIDPNKLIRNLMSKEEIIKVNEQYILTDKVI